MKTIKVFLFVFLLFAAVTINAQVGIGTPTPNTSAQLDVNSTSKGFLPPRMTAAQRDAITSPAAGLVVFNTNTNALEFYTGTGWSSFSTPSTTAVFLPTVVIGTQQWMAKNLDVAFYRNGDPIPQVTDPTAWANLTTGAWCFYNNDSTLGTTYGKLYNSYAVADPRGLAPAGWHVPRIEEWRTLDSSLGSFLSGGKLKEAGTLHWINNQQANNNSGFTALPAGWRTSFGLFTQIGEFGFFWSTSGWSADMSFDGGQLSLFNFWPPNAALSVRCVKDH